MIENLKPDEDMFTGPNGCSWESPKDYLQCDVLGFCGCGNPDEVMTYVKEMLEKIDSSENLPYEDLPSMFFLYWANNKEFAEHGSTVRCSWLTDKGKELLADINKCQKTIGRR